MQRQGVDMKCLSLTTPMVYFASPAFGLARAQCYNDAAAPAHLKYPDKFVGFPQVPMQDPALALKEFDRAARLPGMRGLYRATNIAGAELDDKRFLDIYARCEELG